MTIRFKASAPRIRRTSNNFTLVPELSAYRMELTKAYSTLISIEDYPRVKMHIWSVTVVRQVPYATRGAIRPDGKQRVEYLHRFLLQPHSGQKVDHVSGDTLDNRRTNIRIASHAQNMANKKRSRNNTSGATGVTPSRTSPGKYVAQIACQGKIHYLGMYSTIDEASHIREAAASLLNGPFARPLYAAAELEPYMTRAVKALRGLRQENRTVVRDSSRG
jgi:hypothetical protein